MSRELKFRGWDTRKKVMYSAETMGHDQLTLSVDGRGFINVSGLSTKLSTFPTHIIPMQYTGLPDKNGVDLDWWEGDLISSAKSRVIHEIFWHEKDGQWCGHRINFITDPPEYKPLCEYAQIEGFEVIGNKHQHPHLLEGK